MTLKKDFAEIAALYIYKFRIKHELDFDYWVADRVGEIAFFGDYCFSFNDIRFDIDNKIEETYILDWYDESLSQVLDGQKNINFENWTN